MEDKGVQMTVAPDEIYQESGTLVVSEVEFFPRFKVGVGEIFIPPGPNTDR